MMMQLKEVGINHEIHGMEVIHGFRLEAGGLFF